MDIQLTKVRQCRATTKPFLPMHIEIPGKLYLVSVEACLDSKWQTHWIRFWTISLSLSLPLSLSLSLHTGDPWEHISTLWKDLLTNLMISSPLLSSSTQVHCTHPASENRCQTFWTISLKSFSLGLRGKTGIPAFGDGKEDSEPSPAVAREIHFLQILITKCPHWKWEFSESCNNFAVFPL